MATKSEDNKRELVGFLGVGLDNKDEHQRLTRSEHFLLVGGSEETHERMQDTVLRFNDSLRSQGKSLEQTSPEEAIELLHKAMDS